MRQLREHRVWIAALWLICQSVAVAAVPGRLVCSHVASALSTDKDDHPCCKGGKLCPMHRHQKEAGHAGGHHHDAQAVTSTDTASTEAVAHDAAQPSHEPWAMRAACPPQPAAIVPVLLVPGVVPSVTTVTDDANPSVVISAPSSGASAFVVPPDLPPPR